MRGGLLQKGRDGFYCRYVKRGLDVLCAFLGLTLFCWLYALLAVLVRCKLGSPVLFAQERIGRDEKPFVMYKFRSMSDARDESGALLRDVDRLTPFGMLLRKSSLDELPALWNILRGDMSLIGPRPLPTLYLPYFTPAERARHSIRGGLSGLAQINGRNAISWEARFAYDLRYVETVSFLLDVKIVAITIKKVLRRSDIGLRGVSGPGDFNVCRSKEMESTR